MFTPSLEWPSEMEKFESYVEQSLALCSWLINHYKPLAHASRKLDIHEGFYCSVIDLRRSFHLSDCDLATLLSAGYAVAGKEPIDPQDVRSRMKSAQKVHDESPLQAKAEDAE